MLCELFGVYNFWVILGYFGLKVHFSFKNRCKGTKLFQHVQICYIFSKEYAPFS